MDPLVMLRFTAEGHAPQYYVVAPIHRGQNSHFEAEFFEIAPETPCDNIVGVNFLFRGVPPTPEAEQHWPNIMREIVLVRELLRLAVDWSITIIDSCASSASARLAGKMNAIAFEDLLEGERRRKAEQRLRKQAEQAQKLTDAMLGLAPVRSRTTNKRKDRHTGGKGKGKHTADVNDKADALVAEHSCKGKGAASKKSIG